MNSTGYHGLVGHNRAAAFSLLHQKLSVLGHKNPHPLANKFNLKKFLCQMPRFLTPFPAFFHKFSTTYAPRKIRTAISASGGPRPIHWTMGAAYHFSANKNILLSFVLPVFEIPVSFILNPASLANFPSAPLLK